MSDLPPRFWAKVNKTETCWLWTGYCRPTGYGICFIDGRAQAAHRVVYEAMVGPIPEGQEIDHHCRVRNCVRPDHLESVTHGENIRRAWAAWQERNTACPNGHPYNEANTLRTTNNKGAQVRICRACSRERTRRHKAKAVSR